MSTLWELLSRESPLEGLAVAPVTTIYARPLDGPTVRAGAPAGSFGPVEGRVVKGDDDSPIMLAILTARFVPRPATDDPAFFVGLALCDGETAHHAHPLGAIHAEVGEEFEADLVLVVMGEL